MSKEMNDLRERYKWRKVAAPRAWTPEEEGEELVGFYGGRTLREGQYGQYEVVIVHVPMQGSFTLSGVKVVQLMDAAMAAIGHPVRVVWKGYKETGAGHQMKNYDVLVAEGEAIPAEALPEVPGHTGLPEGVTVNVSLQ
tara:strand:+ start:4933 stop:5349 length:417 start_codon:yes stop_codon:yes gene_type:complete